MQANSAADMPRRLRTVMSRGLAQLGCAALLVSFLPSSGAIAQTASPSLVISAGKGDPSICMVGKSEPDTSSSAANSPLLAICHSWEGILGMADEYNVLVNKDLQAVLVDIRREGTRRLLLISMQANGYPLVEDISGQVAMQAGKGPMSSIADLDIDPAGFASDGTIAVTRQSEDTNGVAQRSSLGLGQQVTALRAVRAALPAQSPAAAQ